ncbi:MAG: OstA-like protein [Candidatus Cloacimonas sp.]
MVKRILICLLVLCLLFPLMAKTQPEEKFRLVHSDKLFMTKMENEEALELNGNVHFFYGNTEFLCRNALILDKQKIARLSGNVIVKNDSLTLEADTLAYYRIPDLMNLGGRITATERTKDGVYRWLKSKYATYDKKNDILTTWNKVHGYDYQENGNVNCGYAQWDRGKGYAILLEEPILSSGRQDTLTVSAEKMEFYDEENKLIATFNVKVDRGDFQSTSDFLIYFLTDEKAVFIGEPKFFSDFADARANEFHLFLKDRTLVKAELIDSCHIDFADERYGNKKNKVDAEMVTMDFLDDQLRNFVAEGKVNYYFQQDQTEKKDFMINSASGVFLQAYFDENSKLQTMQMKTGIKGKYVFKQ